MSITSAVANAHAAAAAGAGKKAAQVQLQAELATDDEWNKFLHRDGLLVVDVYTEWCGPCIGMVGNLKKIKVEIGGDNLHLAVAKADTIECLKRFRNRSEPTWMFLAGGQLVNVVFGADAPRLARTIVEELKNEELVKKGEKERVQRAPHELTPPEQEVALAQEKLLQERREKEASAAEASRLARREKRAARLETHFADICPGLMMPHAQKNLRRISDSLEPYGVLVADKCPVVVGKDGARILAMEDPEFAHPEAAAALVERPALALLLKKMPDKEGNVIELVRRALYGEGMEAEEDAKKTVADELKASGVPGLFVPADRHQRASILDLLFPKMVGGLVQPATPPEPPHIAMIFGAWQRRAVLQIAATPKMAPRLLRYGFFADASIQEHKLLCKTLEKYEERPEKDYSETIVLMVAVGVAEPLLVDPKDIPPAGPPDELLTLGPLHVSEDTVVGAEECGRFFPPGYSVPEQKPRAKSKKKKKKRQETKDEVEQGASTEAPEAIEDAEAGGEVDAEGEGEGEDNGEGEGDAEGEGDGEGDDEEDDTHVDKATSPPPVTT
ncbi:thioredoxin domain-containing protein 3 homolog isoform X2 [Maniola hyperantus]|uniref:thioredoxin domain-containing protein 3 homolog isoform X2 n=2 Tax=Aphantopus hyperantus TaxID=2795564 RepID=UPI001569A5EC|nr:thioredoxin domain-containing protein 3 homolog [Maniola hyperantus]